MIRYWHFFSLIENHLICINYTKSINDDQLIKKYKQIIKSLENSKTKEFIKLYFGNSAINTAELNHIRKMIDDLESLLEKINGMNHEERDNGEENV